MNKKICNVIFGMLVFSLIFNNIPKPIQLNFLGGPAGSKLAVYPLIAAFAYTFYCQYKYKDVFVDIKPFIKYILVFISIMLLSTVVGLFNYPYYDLVLNGPVNQIEKLPKVLAFCHAHGVDVDSKLLMQAWIIARQLKSVLMEAFWCFGGAYIIYCWYKDDWQQAIDILIKSLIASFTVLFLYAVVEVAYLGGNLTSRSILTAINPYIHTIVTSHGWWPPLLWKDQLRLVFPEPSHVGNFIALGLPVIWYKYFNKNEKIWGISLLITIIMSFLVFMTKARTAYAMLFGMTILLLALIVLGKQWKLIKQYIAICVCIAIGFGCFVGFSSIKSNNAAKPKDNIAVEAIENNFTSLASGNKRSNGARYALLKSHFRTGLQHPVLGVGQGLTSAYVEHNFTPEEAKNSEVAQWIKYQQERGPMADGYSIPDAMNEFVTRFSTSGILGFIVFFFPFAYVLLRLLKQWRNDKQLASMFMAFALISSLVAGCNGSVNLLYAIWILLGIAYAMALGKQKEKESNESA